MSKLVSIVTFILILILLSSYLTPQFLPILTLITSTLMLYSLRRSSNFRLLMPLLIMSVALSLTATTILITMVTNIISIDVKLLISLLICTYLPPLAPMTTYYVSICRDYRKYIKYLCFGLTLLVVGTVVSSLEVVINSELIPEVSKLCRGISSLASTSLSLYLCLLTPYSLVLILTSLLVLIIVMIKVFIEFG